MSGRKSTLYNALLFALSVIVSMVVFEFVARKWLHLGNDYPNSSVWYTEKWLENHENPDPTLTGYCIDRYDSLLGWTLKENLRNAEVYGWKVSSNSKGCRGIEEHTYAKGKQLRILAIGDSFTFGECVNDSETFPHYLSIAMDSAEVINLAVHGYGQDQILLRLESEGVKYHPDIVVMGFLNDDMNRNRMSFKDYAKPYFVLEEDSMILQGVPVPAPQSYLEKPRMKSLSMVSALISGYLTKDFDDYTNNLSSRILDRIVKACDSINAPLVLVYLPWKDECFANRPWHSALDSFAISHNVTVIDPTAAMHEFLKTQKSPESHFDCHYSPALNQVLGEKIGEELKMRGGM